MARPPKDTHQKRSIMIRVRFTADEQQRLLTHAAQAHCNISDFIRLKSLDAPPRIKKAAQGRAQLTLGWVNSAKSGAI